MFVMGCQDANHNVANAALAATASYIMQLGNSDEIMIMTAVITPMLNVMANNLKNGDEDLVIEGLDVIQECCTLEQPLVNDFLEVKKIIPYLICILIYFLFVQQIVQFTMGIIHSKEYENSVKQSAGQTIMDVIEYRPKLFAKKNLIGPTLTTLMDMIAKEDSNAAGSLFNFPSPELLEDDEDDEDEYNPEIDVQKLSQTIIDCMAIHIPSKYFSDTVLQLISQGMQSPDPQMRKAGCAVLGVIAEGCADRIRDNIGDILPSVLLAVQDAEFYVRECACFALGQFSEYCQPDILNYYDKVLPVIFHALDDPRPTMQGTSCYVLEYFCENLQPDTLRPYLGALMNKLVVLVQSSQKGTQEMALSAIAATAVAAEVEFLPYAEGVCTILRPLLCQTEPTMFPVRGRALDCLGHIAVALGDQHFAPYFEMGMQSTIQGLQLDSELLKEHSFVFIANISKVNGKDFHPFLANLVPGILEVIQESELVQFSNESDDEEDDEGAGGAGDDDEDDEGSDMGDYRINVMEGFINTKKAAITALGALAEHTKEHFYPYLDQAVQTIITKDIGLLSSFHDVIRSEGLNIMQFLVQCALATHNVSPPKEKELLPLNDICKEVVRVGLDSSIQTIIIDDEKQPVASALETIQAILEASGLVGLQFLGESQKPLIVSLMEGLLLLLAEKAPCQVAKKLDGYDEDNDDDDHDHVVIDAVADLIGILADLMGESFTQYYDEFHKHLLKFTKPARSHSDRTMAIGCFGEVFKALGGGCLKYTESILGVLQAGLNDSAESVRRNSAYCIGVIVEGTGNALNSQFLNFLQWLYPLCIRTEGQTNTIKDGADVDNALAAVARMIITVPESLPLGQILPVILNALPLRGDPHEGETVYGCFVKLLRANEPTTLGMVPQIIAAFGETFSPASKAIDETKIVCSEGLKVISQNPQAAPALQAYLSTITDPAHMNSLQFALQ